jgi:NitT/TauT family transport system ATP-binding protein
MDVAPTAHIELNNISHHYKGGRGLALEGVSAQIGRGEAVALIGRSGCGKSTLLHIAAGMMKPSAGDVRISGEAVQGPSPRWIVMFQQPALYPWMSVRQNVELGLRFTGRMDEAVTRVPQLLDMVELGEFCDRNVQDLSGGQQQRVALARSLAVHPEALFLDEPFSALDSMTRTALQRDIRRIAKDIGITLVVVTHDIGESAIMADRVFVMAGHPGRILASETIDLREDERRGGAALDAIKNRLRRQFEAISGAPVTDDDLEPEPDVMEVVACEERLAFGRRTETALAG